MNLAINGFGRIGRCALKVALTYPHLSIVAINDLADPKTLAHLLRHDTAYGSFDGMVEAEEGGLIVNGKKILVTAEKEPKRLPWKKMHVDVVLECTGRFTDLESASQHLKAGAKRVIISAPAKGEDVPTYVMGVNESMAGASSQVINNASCTTNCIAPIAAVLEKAFGIKRAMMTTIHSYTASQVLQDGSAKDLREARAAAENIIPTTTGAAISTTQVIPELEGLFDGLAIRVPTLVVSLSDFTLLLEKKVTVEEINDCFRRAAHMEPWKGVLEVTDEPLVSSDFIGNPASCIVDLNLTRVVAGDFVKVIAWYDNEWGYANRLVEMALVVGKNLEQTLKKT